jgi:hypothetical protein
MRRLLYTLVLLALGQTGCTTAVIVTYQTLSDVRTIHEQHEDARIMGTIKDNLATKSGIGTALQIHVFSHLGRVVLAGIVEPGSKLGGEAIGVARTVEGVRKVDSVFLPVRPSYPRDLTISLKLEAKVVGDLELRRTQVEWTVLAGTVVVTDRQCHRGALVRPGATAHQEARAALRLSARRSPRRSPFARSC